MALVFDDGALSVVDEWLGGGSSSGNSSKGAATQHQASSSSSSSAAANVHGKAGLGFRGTGKDKDTKKQKDVLQVRLEKQAKRQKRDDDRPGAPATTGDDADDDDEDEGQQLHGIVGDVPISKTKLSMFDKIQAQKRRRPETGQGKKGAKDPATTVAVAAAPVPPPPVVAEEDVPPAAASAPAGSGDGGAGGDGGRRRKRSKTRSKQKNIRRDNRPDEKKPEYLKGELGRPLTEQTKARLGLT